MSFFMEEIVAHGSPLKAPDKQRAAPSVFRYKSSRRAQITRLHSIEAIGQGILAPNADLWSIRLEQSKDWEIGKAAVDGLVTLLGNLGSLYGCSILPARILIHSDSGRASLSSHHWEPTTGVWSPSTPQQHVVLHLSIKILAPNARPALAQPNDSSWVIGSMASDNLPHRSLRFPRAPIRPLSTSQESEPLSGLLTDILDHKAFRPNQLEAILRSLSGKDSVVLLPTAAGKSLIYQFVGMLLPGSVLVISPLKSLMEDQDRMLKSHGIAINSVAHQALRDAVTLRNIFEQNCFVFIAPERLRTVRFLAQLNEAKIGSRSPITVVALDETHCVSEWGHDFRTLYLNVGSAVRKTIGNEICIPALTGTASHWVLTDVRREIGASEAQAIIEARDMDRRELMFDVIPCDRGRDARFLGLLQGLKRTASELGFASDIHRLLSPAGRKTCSGVIFCRTANECQRVLDYLGKELGVTGAVFHGDLPPQQKSDIQRRFLRNEIPLLIATKAFGMGIDKPNIRFIIHSIALYLH